MTKEEIKSSVSMREVIESHGIKINKAGFCKCPFHSSGVERTASMKVYDHSYNCYACGANGDVFTFIMEYEGLSFKDAFISLGGEYKFTSDKEKKRIIAKREREQQKKEREERAKFRFYISLRDTLTGIQEGLMFEEPLSYNWCLLMDARPKFEYWWQCLIDGEEINKIDVSRAIRKLNEGFSLI